MNRFRATGITLLALSMGLSPLAMAQGRGDEGGQGRDRGADRRGAPERDHSPRQDGSSRWDGPRADNHRGERQREHRRDDWRDDRRGDRPVYRDAPRYDPPPRGQMHGGDRRGDWRGAGPRHDIYRGAYLPPQYRGRSYVVDDWRGHRLYAPPRGYHWVQAGGDYVLAAIATGVILQILLNN